MSFCNSNRIHCGNLARAIARREAALGTPTSNCSCNSWSPWSEVEKLRYIHEMACVVEGESSLEMEDMENMEDAPMMIGAADCDWRYNASEYEESGGEGAKILLW